MILTGAGAKKTEKQRRIFGGLANAAYDTCYHQPCDDVENVNEDAIKIVSTLILQCYVLAIQQLTILSYSTRRLQPLFIQSSASLNSLT